MSEIVRKRVEKRQETPRKPAAVMVDGTGFTPGTERCACGSSCGFPCWQRVGIAARCEACGCAAMPDLFLPTTAVTRDDL